MMPAQFNGNWFVCAQYAAGGMMASHGMGKKLLSPSINRRIAG
jgi:hypothetical protein